MYLLDTNILLEFLLNQERADDVEMFLRGTPQEKLYLSEFSLYSLGIILLRRKMSETFTRTVDDLFLQGGIRLVRLGVAAMMDIVKIAQKFNLDFDDAYQYTAAEQYDLTLVSFDHDFDRTEMGRKTPAQVLAAEEI